jgi:hypothetical protein
LGFCHKLSDKLDFLSVRFIELQDGAWMEAIDIMRRKVASATACFKEEEMNGVVILTHI